MDGPEGKQGQGPGAGRRFQRETKYAPEELRGYELDWQGRPAGEKHYDGAARTSLAKPRIPADPGSLLALLARRRSRRVYDPEATLDIGLLGELLWATQGISAARGESGFRTAPSAGALYPIETYLLCRRVTGLTPGIYHFRPGHFDLELVREGDYSRDCALGALGQSMIADAQVTFLWSAVVARVTWKYRERGYRYLYLDAGHLAENLYLAAEARGLGVCGVGAFFDDELNGLIGLDGEEETVIYGAPVGVPRPGRSR